MLKMPMCACRACNHTWGHAVPATQSQARWPWPSACRPHLPQCKSNQLTRSCCRGAFVLLGFAAGSHPAEAAVAAAITAFKDVLPQCHEQAGKWGDAGMSAEPAANLHACTARHGPQGCTSAHVGLPLSITGHTRPEQPSLQQQAIAADLEGATSTEPHTSSHPPQASSPCPRSLACRWLDPWHSWRKRWGSN